MMTSIHHIAASLCRRLHLDERGTTITEFVIVLPVFVLIFSATLALSRMQHTGIEVQIRASSDMWEQAIAIQTDTALDSTSSHMMPAQGSAEARVLLDSLDPDSPARDASSHIMMSNRWAQSESNGHMGEAKAMVDPIQAYMPDNFGLDAYSKLQQAHSRYNDVAMVESHDSVGDLFDPVSKHAAFHLLNDASSMQALPTSNIQQPWNGSGLYPLLDSTTPEGTIYSNVAGMMGSSRMALATGLRYGTVRGIDEQEVIHPMFPSSPMLSAGFDTLIAPKAHQTDEEHARTNYISHMTLMNESLYSTLLGIEYEERFEYDPDY